MANLICPDCGYEMHEDDHDPCHDCGRCEPNCLCVACCVDPIENIYED